ncbi:MAG: nucleotidyltransferase family protein [Gemmatimonadaceae bacterium]
MKSSAALGMLSPEARLVLYTAGGPENDDLIREALREHLDWPRILAIAQWEKATAIIWRRLSTSAGAVIPAAFSEAFWKQASVAEFRLTYLEQRLEESVAALRAAGIEVMLLKGAALGRAVYPSFTERPMSDLDLLVRPEEAQAARDTLLSAGWSWTKDEISDARYRDHHHLPPLSDSLGTGVKLEVHRNLLFDKHPFRFSADDLWAAARPVQVGRETAMAPSDYHLLLHSAIHFSWSHLLVAGGWRTFRDITAIVEASGERWDWERFASLAAYSRGGTCCYWTFRLARNLAGIDVPDEVIEELRPRLSPAVMDRLERHFAVELFAPEALCPSVQLSRTMWQLAILPGRNGHGAVRPWHGERVHDPDVGEKKGRSRLLLDHIRNAGSWGRYVSVIGRRP